MQLMTTDIDQRHVLRSPALPIQFPLTADVRQFIDAFKLFFSDLQSPFGKPAGLAAPQVGVSLRIAIIQIPAEAKQIRRNVYDVIPPTLLINPSYTPVLAEGQNKDWEACFSVTNKMGEVNRHNVIHYEAYQESGEKTVGIARGFLARLIQHEVGHLNSELYTDLICADCRFGAFDEMLVLRKNEMLNCK